jgi:hypothetical protein
VQSFSGLPLLPPLPPLPLLLLLLLPALRHLQCVARAHPLAGAAVC